ncbi:MAG: hypothetical protein V2A56_01610 [bacterium]
MIADPSHFAITLRDLIYFGSLVVTVSLAFGRLRSDLRHLDDVKANRSEVEQFGLEIRARLADIQTSLARLEQAFRSKV